MYVPWCLVLLLGYTTRVAQGYSSGAPVGRCDNMIPAHRREGTAILSQRLPSPYNFQLQKYTYSDGEQIRMRLVAPQNAYFKGLLVKVVTQQGEAVGTVIPPRGYKAITCGLNGNEALTHTEKSNKPGVIFIWTAPSTAYGPLTVRTTIVYNYGTFWVNEVQATINPVASTLPQVSTTVRPPPTPIVPVLTTTIPSTDKSPVLTTQSEVNLMENLTSISNVSYIQNATAVTGHNFLLHNDTTTNNLLKNIHEDTAKQVTNMTDYNGNNKTNFIQNIAASLMLSSISNLADDYYAFTNPLNNRSATNESMTETSDPSGSFISVLDGDLPIKDNVNSHTLPFNISESVSVHGDNTHTSEDSDAKSSSNNTSVRTVQKSLLVNETTELSNFSTSVVYQNTTKKTVNVSADKINVLTYTNPDLGYSSTIPYTKFSASPTSHSRSYLESNTNKSGEKFTSAPGETHFNTNYSTTNSLKESSTTQMNHSSFSSASSTLPADIFQTSLSISSSSSAQNTTQVAVTVTKQNTEAFSKLQLAYISPENNITTEALSSSHEIESIAKSTAYQQNYSTTEETSTNKIGTLVEEQTFPQANDSNEQSTRTNADMNDNSTMLSILNLRNGTTSNSDIRSTEKSHDNITETFILNQTTSRENVSNTESVHINYAKTTIDDTTYPATKISTTTNAFDVISTKASATELPYAIKVTLNVSINETVTRGTTLPERSSVNGNKHQEVTTLSEAFGLKENSKTSTSAVVQSTSSFENHKTSTHFDDFLADFWFTSSVASTEATTATTLPPIIVKTFRPRPSVRKNDAPRTTDVWLNMKPVPFTVNNLFNLLPTTRRVWLRVEPTRRPPIFMRPVFKAPPLPSTTTTTQSTTRSTQPQVRITPPKQDLKATTVQSWRGILSTVARTKPTIEHLPVSSTMASSAVDITTWQQHELAADTSTKTPSSMPSMARTKPIQIQIHPSPDAGLDNDSFSSIKTHPSPGNINDTEVSSPIEKHISSDANGDTKVKNFLSPAASGDIEASSSNKTNPPPDGSRDTESSSFVKKYLSSYAISDKEDSSPIKKHSSTSFNNATEAFQSLASAKKQKVQTETAKLSATTSQQYITTNRPEVEAGVTGDSAIINQSSKLVDLVSRIKTSSPKTVDLIKQIIRSSSKKADLMTQTESPSSKKTDLITQTQFKNFPTGNKFSSAEMDVKLDFTSHSPFGQGDHQQQIAVKVTDQYPMFETASSGDYEKTHTEMPKQILNFSLPSVKNDIMTSNIKTETAINKNIQTGHTTRIINRSTLFMGSQMPPEETATDSTLPVSTSTNMIWKIPQIVKATFSSKNEIGEKKPQTGRATDIRTEGTIQYDPDCGFSKGCFVDCDSDGCKFMVTWQDVGEAVAFELYGKPKYADSWVAVGFSKDSRMTDDSVTECVHNGGFIQAFNSYNPSYTNNRLQNSQVGLTGVSGSYYNGVFSCRFTRAKRVETEPHMFDLENDWNIMFAHGKARPGFTISVHSETPATSASHVDFQKFIIVGRAARFSLVKAHGCLMILAWVLFTGVGIVLARYYKNVWADKTFLKLKIWFQAHRACMVTALVLDLIAFIIIFVDVKGYSQIPDIPGKTYLRSHPILGIIVTLLCVANPVMALFRPGPGDSKRPIFNWAHWGVGITAYILSALCICFGFQLGKASTPDYAVYIMIGYIIYVVLFDIACEVHDYLTKKEKKGKVESMEMSNHNGTDNGVANGNSTNYSTKEKTKKSDKLKTILLAVHIAFTGAFALVLVLVVALN